MVKKLLFLKKVGFLIPYFIVVIIMCIRLVSWYYTHCHETLSNFGGKLITIIKKYILEQFIIPHKTKKVRREAFRSHFVSPLVSWSGIGQPGIDL